METLSLEQISNWAEIIGVILVILSLIYVGREVGQNTATMQVSAAQTFVDLYNTITSQLTLAPDLADIWYRGLTGFASLKNDERVRFSTIAGQTMRVFESGYLQYRKDALDEQIWVAFSNSLADITASPGMREWWKTRQHWYSPDFQELVKTAEEKKGSQIYSSLADA